MSVGKESSREAKVTRESSRSRLQPQKEDVNSNDTKVVRRDKDNNRSRDVSKDKVKRHDSKTREPATERVVSKRRVDPDAIRDLKLKGPIPKSREPLAGQLRKERSSGNDVKTSSTTTTRENTRVRGDGDVVKATRGAVPKHSSTTIKVPADKDRTSTNRVSKKPTLETNTIKKSIDTKTSSRKERIEKPIPSSSRKTPETQTKTRRTAEDMKERDKTQPLSRRDTMTKKENDKLQSKTKREPEQVQEKTDVKKTRTRTRTRVLSPSEVKMEHDHTSDIAVVASKGTSRVEDKDKTNFTVQIVPSFNDVDGPRKDTSFPIPVASTSKEADVFGALDQNDGDDYDYEDDFEDYESDFEEDSSCANDEDAPSAKDEEDDGGDKEGSVIGELNSRLQPSVDEDKKLDSGNYDMAENQRRSKHFHEIKAAIDKENTATRRQEYHLPSKDASLLVDEGFEDEKTEERPVKTTIPQSASFVNFATARKRQMEQKVTARARKRGDELLSMIKLDVMKYKLFEMAPVAYDAYMSSYGRTGTVQAQVQTNNDNLSEEVQTDEICTKDMWTQKPTAYQTQGNETFVKTTRDQDRLGVGGNITDDGETTSQRININPESLTRFLSTAGPRMLHALWDNASHGKLKAPVVPITFSKGYFSLGVKTVPFLANRAVTLVRYPMDQTTILLTVHAAAHASSDLDESLSRCVICVWNTLDPNSPQHMLTTWQEITAACFNSARASMVVGGCEDGSVCVWDLREKSTCHQEVSTWILRSPTYSTAEVLKEDGHLGRVVSLCPLVNKESAVNEYSATQVCSLDDCGTVIIWTIIQSLQHGMLSGVSQHDLGMAHWGRVRLVKSTTIVVGDNLPIDSLLQTNLLFTDLQMNNDDSNHIYVSTNTGHVIHSMTIGGKPVPRVYRSKSDGIISAECIEPTPFGHSLFLVGCGDGSIRLHRRESENPLTTLAGTGDGPGQGPPIMGIQWSRSKPTVFFVLDKNSRIHVWDLSKSDMYPRSTLALKGVTTIQLAPELRDGKTSPQLVIATAKGRVEVHDLKDELRFRTTADMIKELNSFHRFTNVL